MHFSRKLDIVGVHAEGEVGDVIVEFDGKEVKAGDELVVEIAGRKPGSKAKLGFLRNGKKEELSVTVADRSKLFASRLGEEEPGGPDEPAKESKLGVTVRSVTPELAGRLDIPAGKGVAVQDVKPGSFADDIGLSRGDLEGERLLLPATRFAVDAYVNFVGSRPWIDASPNNALTAATSDTCTFE